METSKLKELLLSIHALCKEEVNAKTPAEEKGEEVTFDSITFKTRNPSNDDLPDNLKCTFTFGPLNEDECPGHMIWDMDLHIKDMDDLTITSQGPKLIGVLGELYEALSEVE